MNNSQIKKINIKKNTIAYSHNIGKKSNSKKGIVFLSGFMSNMAGSKALYLENKCKICEREFLRFDYSGHGISSGNIVNSNIGRWLDESLYLIQKLTKGPQILIGSSMGGWLATIIAKKIPKKIHSLIGIAPAIDFTKTLWDYSLTTKQKNILNKKGSIRIKNEYSEEGYIFTKKLFLEAEKHLLLNNRISVNCPVKLIYGTKDIVVKREVPIKLMLMLESNNVDLIFIKNGDHRMSKNNNLETIWKEVIKLDSLN